MIKLARFFSPGARRNSLDRPIFIWGSPRSGTTLLYRFITKHHDVGYPRRNEKIPREGTDFWWRVFGEHRGVMDAYLAHPKSVKQIHRDYGMLLQKQGKSRLLDKIPFMTLWVHLVNEVFPDSRHFHIIRDGRAVVNSILYKLRFSKKDQDRCFQKGELLYGPQPSELINPMSQPPAQRHARQWMLLVEHGRRNAELLKGRYCEMRYEDLVNAPRSAMKKVFEHAQLLSDDKFIYNNYPDKLKNKNINWRSEKHEVKDHTFTAHCAYENSDIPYLKEMNPLLSVLDYEEL